MAKDQRGRQDLQVLLVKGDLLVLLDQAVLVGHLVIPVLKVMLAQQVIREHKASRDSEVHQGLQALQDSEVILACLAHQDNLVNKDQLETKDQQVQRVT